MSWVRIRSWHLVRTFTRGGQVLTLCGRRVTGDLTTAATLPEGEKSCERCFQLREAN